MKNLALTPVKSSNLKAVGYDATTKTLVVEFHSGKKYSYADVPAEKHAAMLAADSVGKHFGAHIRNNHPAKPL